MKNCPLVTNTYFIIVWRGKINEIGFGERTVLMLLLESVLKVNVYQLCRLLIASANTLDS